MDPSPRCRRGDVAWDEYVGAFHRERPGITERVLRRASWQGRDPYVWCAAAVGDHGGLVLDVACGSGPLADHVSSWLGVDRAVEELRVARAAGRCRLVEATASDLPFSDGGFDAVVVAMALQVLRALDEAVAELARVTRPEATLVVLLPARRPLPWRDVLLYSRLQLRLRRRIDYPNDVWLEGRRAWQLMTTHGFEVISDDRVAFALRLASIDDADEFARSLYLPAVPPSGVTRAAALLRRRVGGEVTVPLRRIVLRRSRGDA